MDSTERQVIDELFAKIRQAEAQTGPRDDEAETLIRSRVAEQPAAPYYMAQAIVVQEQALAAAQARIEELEQQAASRPAAGGFLGGLFGGGDQPTQPPQGARRGAPPAGMDPRVAPYVDPRRGHGSGFLAGAAQTAMGVAGGVLLANALAGLFTADPAAADVAGGEPAPADLPEDTAGDGFDDMDSGFFDDEF